MMSSAARKQLKKWPSEWLRKRLAVGSKAIIIATIVWLGPTWGCGSNDPAPAVPNVAPQPIRQLTAGDSLLQLLPAGADTLLELDLARLRKNASIGGAVRALLTTNREQQNGGLLEVSDTIVVASYGIGTSSTERVILCRGSGVETLANSTLVNVDQTRNMLENRRAPNARQASFVVAVIASPQMTRQIEAIAVGNKKPLATDSKLLVLRALAMPAAAEGASFRLSAHLGFDARLALGKAMDLESVPVSVSVWADVADDLAIVTLVAGKDQPDGRVLVNSLARMRDKFAALTEIRLLGLSRIIRGATLDAQGSSARLVLVIGPKRLRRVAARVVRRLETFRQVDTSETGKPTSIKEKSSAPLNDSSFPRPRPKQF